MGEFSGIKNTSETGFTAISLEPKASYWDSLKFYSIVALPDIILTRYGTHTGQLKELNPYGDHLAIDLIVVNVFAVTDYALTKDGKLGARRFVRIFISLLYLAGAINAGIQLAK